MAIHLRDDERLRDPAETRVERVRKAVEDETGRRLPRFFRPARRTNVGGPTGSGPVTKVIDGADTGAWLNEVVARHRANVYDWTSGGQPTGAEAETPGSLRVEQISEARELLRERLGRQPTDQEMEAVVGLMVGIQRRQLGDASATVPPGSRATPVSK